MTAGTKTYSGLRELSGGAARGGATVEGVFDEVVRGQTLTEQVYGQLRQGLLLGIWKPGDKITARKLSRTLGVSLTPAREAIIRLSDEGAIAVSDKRTFSIPKLNAQQYAEITQVRALLEPEATAIATARAERGLPDRLARLNEQLKAHILAEEFDDALRVDSEFHLSIYDGARAPVLRKIIDSLWLQVGPTRTRLSQAHRRQLIGYANHVRIIDAMRRGDSSAAADAMRDDLQTGARAVISELE